MGIEGGTGRARPRVRSGDPGLVRVEHGSVGAVGDADRVAVMAHYSRDALVSRSASRLVDQLRTGGYAVVLVSTAEADGPLLWPGARPDLVLRRPNTGYDFGSWSVGLASVPPAARSPRVLLVNDSMVGPFADLAPALRSFDTAVADVWGLTDTRQYVHHLQTYFVGFRDGVLADPPLSRFWDDIRHEATKWDVIRRNELGLGRILHEEGYLTSAMFSGDRYVQAGANPVIGAWRRLLVDGFPFVKRELVRDPRVAEDGHLVPGVLAREYGIELREWV